MSSSKEGAKEMYWHSKLLPKDTLLLDNRVSFYSQSKIIRLQDEYLMMMGGLCKTITMITKNRSINLLLYHRRIRLSSIEKVYKQT